MKEQRHEINFGEGGKAILIVDNPFLKFWKKANVYYDLAGCEEKYRRIALKEFTKIISQKSKRRLISIPIIIQFRHF